MILQAISRYPGFGGVGASGYGRYIGFEGFKSFSNPKTIITRPPMVPNFILSTISPPFFN